MALPSPRSVKVRSAVELEPPRRLGGLPAGRVVLVRVLAPVGPWLWPGLAARECQPQDGAVHNRELLQQPHAVVGEAVARRSRARAGRFPRTWRWRGGYAKLTGSRG